MRISLIAIVVLIIGLGSWWYFAGQGTEQTDTAETTAEPTGATVPETTPTTSPPPSTDPGEPAPAEEEPAVVEVSYTSGGFNPSNITIAAGQTIKFTNDSNSLMWVASNPHPIHTDFSAFDSQRGVAKGQSYSFTFSKPGTYGYHNHLNDPHDGNIIVK